MKTHKQFRSELLQNPKLKKIYDDLELEFKLYEAIVEARIQKKMTQRQLADRAGIAQSALSRIETGKVNSTIKSIQKLLALTGNTLKIVPM